MRRAYAALLPSSGDARRTRRTPPQSASLTAPPLRGGASSAQILHRAAGEVAASAIALGLAATLTACAPKAKPAQAVALDCSQPFEALKAKIIAQPGLAPAPQEPSEPYRAYSTQDGHASYFITEPGAPAHPAILMQQTAGGAMTNTGCPYGDKAAYDQLMAYLTGLKAGRK